jgi:hypothetical protein
MLIEAKKPMVGDKILMSPILHVYKNYSYHRTAYGVKKKVELTLPKECYNEFCW